jgi:hypothetical protein
VDEVKKNPECGRSKEQCSPARIVSGNESLKSHGNQGRIYGEGWGMFFSKAASKGLQQGGDALRATSHTRLKAHDHCNLRALIGRKGGDLLSSLQTRR